LQLLTGCVAFRFHRSDALPERVQFQAQAIFALALRSAVAPLPLTGAPQGALDFIIEGVSPSLFSGTQRLNPRKRLQLNYSVNDMACTLSVPAGSRFRVPCPPWSY
jgi:hypothetical protein